MTDPTPTSPLALMLFTAHTRNLPVAAIPGALTPDSAEAAYRVQDELLRLRASRIKGWKVGGRIPPGQGQAAPLPGEGVMASPGRWPRARQRLLGLELELGFQFGRPFEPRAAVFGEAEVLGGLKSMMATIEVVVTRCAQWPAVDKLVQLADLQNHGALVLGETAPYRLDFPFEAPDIAWQFNGVDFEPRQSINPAGDPRSLLVWVVNHCSARGIRIEENTVITTGSYTGLHLPTTAGTAIGRFGDLPAVQLTLT